MDLNRQKQIMAASGVLSLGVLMFLEPIPQDEHYHCFADQETILGIPHFWNVISNLPFCLVGAYGMSKLRGKRMQLGAEFAAWWVLFAAFFVVGIGSSYYHWEPNTKTLFWDRLPMTFGFMALTCALLTRFVTENSSRFLLPLCAAGVASVVYWRESNDLRFYAWIQFFPLLLILMMLIWNRHKKRATKPVLWALVFYVLAKILEAADQLVMDFLGGLMSGHALKHLAAALGCYALIACFDRPPRPETVTEV